MRRLWEGVSLEVAGAKEKIMVGDGKYFSMRRRRCDEEEVGTSTFMELYTE